MRDVEEVAATVVHASLRIHRDLGPGLLESVYETVLGRVLEDKGFHVERQKVIRFEYEGLVFEDHCRADLMIDGQLIVEIKSVEHLSRAHPKQLLTYLKLSNTPVGLLINFGAPVLRDGLRRIVNGYVPSAPSRLRVNQK